MKKEQKMKKEQWMPNQNDLINVTDVDNASENNWYIEKFVAYYPNLKQPWITYNFQTGLAAWKYARPAQQKEEEFKLWDVVQIEDDLGKIIIRCPVGKDVFYRIYCPETCKVSAFELGAAKKLRNKIAMAPAKYTRISADGSIYHAMSEQLFSDFEAARLCLMDKFVRWPHSIAALTIEERE